MNKPLRLSEKWYRVALWLVALVFAGFLIGLGSNVVGDLPRFEGQLTLDDFVNEAAAAPLRISVKEAARTEAQARQGVEQAELQLRAAAQASANARETFANWLATRRATQSSDQDVELINRTRALDALKAREATAQKDVDALSQTAIDARQTRHRQDEKIAALEADAQKKLMAEYRRIELRVFGWRLALTLPLLAIAGWLFAKKRKSTWWPFVWGFIFFALFAFFVELVPYLPSYGGYVRYLVGIVVTVLVGRYAIVALNRYLERQRLAEGQPDNVRRSELSYDTALARLSKNVCPGCERPVDLQRPKFDFCPHCGIGLFDHCGVCESRKSAFAKFCDACGAPARREADPAPPSPAAVAPTR